MTSRVHSLTVVLDANYREDDISKLIEAIECFRGVVSVRGHVSNIETHMAQERALANLREKIFEVFEKDHRERDGR